MEPEEILVFEDGDGIVGLGFIVGHDESFVDFWGSKMMWVYSRGYIVLIGDFLIVFDDFGLLMGEFPCGNESVADLKIDIVFNESGFFGVDWEAVWTDGFVVNSRNWLEAFFLFVMVLSIWLEVTNFRCWIGCLRVSGLFMVGVFKALEEVSLIVGVDEVEFWVTRNSGVGFHERVCVGNMERDNYKF